jgi:CRP-like cAMP-binding protein
MQEKIFKKDEFIFKAGETSNFLYKIVSGKIFSFIIQGSKISPLGLETAGSFSGSNSFFLKKPTGTFSIAMEETKVIIYDQKDLEENFPTWLKTVAQGLVRKTEEQMIQVVGHGIRKASGKIRPLSIEEQRHYLQLAEKK